MSERLSQDHLMGIYDAGYQGFSKVKAKSKPVEVLNFVDFDSLMSGQDSQERLQEVPAQTLYYSLLKRGLNDCVEILPLISADQFVRICDYDLWNEDRLVSTSAFKWLNLYHEAAPEQMLERYRQLDEEYQIALLSPYCRVFSPDEVETMSEEQQDMLYRFPSDSLFYSINSADPQLHNGICQLIDTAMGEDMAYAMSLLSHASCSVPNEEEHLMLQFRTARLEEDGYVSYEESRRFFYPQSILQTEIDELVTNLPSSRQIISQDMNSRSFLEKSLNYGAQNLWTAEEHLNIQRGLLQLANATCAAAKVEPDDQAGLRDILEYTSGLISFSLELLCAGDSEAAAKRLQCDFPKKIFTIALGFVDELRQGMINCLKQKPFANEASKALEKYHLQHKFAQIQNTLDISFTELLGAESVQVLKGLFNRFPLTPVPVMGQEGDVVERLRFCALSSLSEFGYLINACKKISEEMQIVSWACETQSTRIMLDQHLLRALMHARIGESFHSQDPTEQSIELFVYGTKNRFTPLQDIVSQVESRLDRDQPWLWSDHGFVRKHLVQRISADSVQSVLADLNERLEIARSQGRESLNELLAGKIRKKKSLTVKQTGQQSQDFHSS